MARLTQLQRLDLLCVEIRGSGVLPGSMLASLQALTGLHLSCLGLRWLQPATLQHLGSLRGLQELTLHDPEDASELGAALTAVQHLRQLTTLELSRVHALALPSLSSSLRRLFLRRCKDFEPQALAACTQLQHLSLKYSAVAGGPEGAATLLAHLQRCTQLTRLELYQGALNDPAPAACAALTASSSLEVLEVRDRLPAAAWQAMFGGSKRLPRLRMLRLGFSSAGSSRADGGLQAADMQALVRCCPALQELFPRGLPGLSLPDLQPLTALTGLTVLRVGGFYPDWEVDIQTEEGQPPDMASRPPEAISEYLEQQAAEE